jgi:hypothetical protein
MSRRNRALKREQALRDQVVGRGAVDAGRRLSVARVSFEPDGTRHAECLTIATGHVADFPDLPKASRDGERRPA